MRQKPTCVGLLAENSQSLELGQEGAGVTELFDACLGGWHLDDDQVVHGVTVVLISEDNTLEVFLLGWVVLGWEEDSEPVAGVWYESCRKADGQDMIENKRSVA